MVTCGICNRAMDDAPEGRRVQITNDDSVPEELRAPEGKLAICDECWNTSVAIIKAKKADEN